MRTYILDIPGKEIIRLVRAETEAAGGQPELNIVAARDYVIEEEFDRRVYGMYDGKEYDLVSAELVLSIEPRVERDYWILKIVVRKELGLCTAEAEESLCRADLTLDEFAADFQSLGGDKGAVRLKTATVKAKTDFDRWLAELRGRYPRVTEDLRKSAAAISETGGADEGRRQRADDNSDEGTWIYRAREAVGVFDDGDALEAAVDELEIAGFNRAAVSVLATDEKVKERIRRVHRTATEAEDDARAPQSAFISKDSLIEAEAALVGFPIYVGGIFGAFAAVASGGALAAAIATAFAGGAAGAGLGAFLARAMARRHVDRVQEQLRRGGLVLWVSVPDKGAENRALGVLAKARAHDIHVHEILRKWGLKDVLLHGAQLDPFLEPDG